MNEPPSLMTVGVDSNKFPFFGQTLKKGLDILVYR